MLLYYADFSFTLFTGLVGLSILFMLLNKNLVYSVLNLGLLSFVLVFMWMYFLEINFILILYILAFIGAIVMLFLSVVLMLPSSTFSEQKMTAPFLFVVDLFYQREHHFLLANWFYLVLINILALIFYILSYEPDFNAVQLNWKIRSSLFVKKTSYFPSWNTFYFFLEPKFSTFKNIGLQINFYENAERFFSRKWIQWNTGLLLVFDFLGQLFYKAVLIGVVALQPPAGPYVVPQSQTIHSENLLAIKSILYLEQPLWLLISVLGLLVALFGVTVVVSEK